MIPFFSFYQETEMQNGILHKYSKANDRKQLLSLHN